MLIDPVYRSPREVMDALRNQQRSTITASMIYTSRAGFDTNDAARVLRVDRSVAANVLEGMVVDGILVKNIAQNKKITYNAKGINWLRRSWRNNSNEALGVRITRFGQL